MTTATTDARTGATTTASHATAGLPAATAGEAAPQGLTAELAAFVAAPGLDPAAIAPALAIAQTGFIDTLATLLAGHDEPVVRLVRAQVAERRAQAAEASVLMGRDLLPAIDAALINATAGHALDYDDVALGGHPSTVLVPAILAEGEHLGRSGADALEAYLVGYEVWAELLSREPDPHHLKGWHPTSVFGTVGAAAAVARLHRLDAARCRHAIALAASMACGLVANFGTMTKPLHAGRAAAAAIEAVRLAARGFTAAPDAIEHRAGYLAALSPAGRADTARPAATLGRTLRILDSGLSIKKYPICYATHRVIDGVLDLARAHDIAAADVAEVHARVGVAQASMLRNHAPVTGLEARFSLEFAVASSLVARRVGLAELTDGFVATPAVRELMTRLRISTDDSACPIEPVFAVNDAVEIVLRDGRTLRSGDIRFARGNAKLPLALPDLKAKFVDCAAQCPGVDAERLFGRLVRLADQPSLQDLCRTARG